MKIFTCNAGSFTASPLYTCPWHTIWPLHNFSSRWGSECIGLYSHL